MPIDYKKTEKRFYLSKTTPEIIDVPEMVFLMVDGGARRHHEIYLSDPRRIAPEKLKTVIRHPIRRALPYA